MRPLRLASQRAGALPVRLAPFAIALALLACETDQQKCDKAVAAAESAWTGYVAALERALTAAKSLESESQAKLIGEVDRRLGPLAQEQASARYDRGTEAWLRAQESVRNQLCARDPECSTHKRRGAEAKVAREDLAERIPLAKAALAAARGPIEPAQQAAAAVIIHPEYPRVKAAQALTAEAAERCRELPPAKPP